MNRRLAIVTTSAIVAVVMLLLASSMVEAAGFGLLQAELSLGQPEVEPAWLPWWTALLTLLIAGPPAYWWLYIRPYFGEVPTPAWFPWWLVGVSGLGIGTGLLLWWLEGLVPWWLPTTSWLAEASRSLGPCRAWTKYDR